jgi:hypothetical protein
MMLMLARPNVTPPGGFHYRDPDLDVEFEGQNVEHLAAQVARARQINRLPEVPDLAAVVEDVLCRNLPASLTRKVVPAGRAGAAGTGSSSLTPPSPQSQSAAVSESEAIQHTLKLLRRAPRLISWNMAVPRASLCRSCPFNTMEPCCYGCKVESVFAVHVGSVRYRAGSDMSYAGVCAVDKTFCKAVMRVNDPKVFGAGGYPVHCWKLIKETLG